MTKSTLTLTQSGLLAPLLEHQRRKVIELARRRAHREHVRDAFWNTLSRPFRALAVRALEPPLWTRRSILKRPMPLFVRIQQVVAIAALGFLFWLWLGISDNHSTRPSYPYYDRQGPVPPWSEPTPLERNYNRKGDHR